MPTEPVKITPRLDAKPWGGRRLAAWGIALPPGESIGEALLTAPDAVVASGSFQGVTLGELAHQNPAAWVGENGLAATGGRPIFPLLVKLIDSHANLSIQVHPDDHAAAAADLGTGKTEAYHILSADPGGVVYLGLRPDSSEREFAAACRRADGSAAALLRRLPAEAGMSVLIPAGAPHALGAGVVLYEIQQPSNVTFRLDDWGRLDAAGRPRPLHHDAGLSVLDPRSRPEPIAPVVIDGDPEERLLLVATRYFALERFSNAPSASSSISPVDSPQTLTAVRGDWTVSTASGAVNLSRGETIVLPAAFGAELAAAEGGAVLRGWVPNLERDVFAPARAAGASPEQIRGLAGTSEQA